MIIVYDYETRGINPYETNPVQLAAVPIDEITYKIYEDEIFNTRIKPPDVDSINTNDENVNWHAKHQKCTAEDIINNWKKAPTIDSVWGDFMNYCLKFNKNKNKFSAPIRAGHNIIGFDDIITSRIHGQYGKSKCLFRVRDYFDTLNLSYLWLRTNPDIKSYTLDNLRDYFGLSKELAHDAKKDILDTAIILVHFLNLHDKFGKRVIFKGSLRNE